LDEFVLMGGPGLLLGLGLGYAIRRWRAAVALLAVGAIGAWLLVRAAEDPLCEDDCPHVLVAIAGLTNVVALAVGLAAGTALGRRKRSI
jgi:hypothetical protein